MSAPVPSARAGVSTTLGSSVDRTRGRFGRRLWRWRAVAAECRRGKEDDARRDDPTPHAAALRVESLLSEADLIGEPIRGPKIAVQGGVVQGGEGLGVFPRDPSEDLAVPLHQLDVPGADVGWHRDTEDLLLGDGHISRFGLEPGEPDDNMHWAS